MQTALKLRTTVRAGRRIEVDAPELPEGTEVELIILPELPTTDAVESRRYGSVLEFLELLPERRHTAEEWAEIERELQQEKDAWER